MSFKFVAVFCAYVLLSQGVNAQCIGAPLAVPSFAPCAGAWGAPYTTAEWDYAPASSLAASNGPGVSVATVSPILPAGVSVLSDNAYEGILAVDGTLPFLGTVGFEGELPTAGSGVVAYNCGNGVVGITAENGAYGVAGPLGYGAVGAPVTAGQLAATPYAGNWGAAYTPAEWAYAPVAALSASNGPGLAVSSVSSIVPTGVSVQSENIYEGELAVDGALPFLGSVALEGALPTIGAGAVAYGCGDGSVGITAEDLGAAGYGAGLSGSVNYGSGFAAPFSIDRSGWGCRAI